MQNQMSDLLTIYHQGLNVFPYWTDELIAAWEEMSIKLIEAIQTGLTKKEFYKKLKQLSALLNDGHAFIYLPNDIKEALYSPVSFKQIDNQLVIENTQSDFLNNRFLPIKQINQMSGAEFLEKISHFYWKNNSNQSLKMAQMDYNFLLETESFLIEFENGETVEIPFSSEKLAIVNGYEEKIPYSYQELLTHEAISIYQFSKKVVIKLNHFMSEEMVELFYRFLPEYLEAEEIIFDMRNNGGGNSGLANEITQAFFEGPFEIEKISSQTIEGEYIASGTVLNSGDYNPNLETDPELIKMNQMLKHQYLTSRVETANHINYQGLLKEKPVKILQNDLTYSAAENFIMNFANAHRARLIGEVTAGSTGQPALFPLKTGGLFIVTAKKVEFPNGKSHHNIGIQPDVYVTNSLADLREGLDKVLIYALEH